MFCGIVRQFKQAVDVVCGEKHGICKAQCKQIRQNVHNWTGYHLTMVTQTEIVDEHAPQSKTVTNNNSRKRKQRKSVQNNTRNRKQSKQNNTRKTKQKKAKKKMTKRRNQSEDMEEAEWQDLDAENPSDESEDDGDEEYFPNQTSRKRKLRKQTIKRPKKVAKRQKSDCVRPAKLKTVSQMIIDDEQSKDEMHRVPKKQDFKNASYAQRNKDKNSVQSPNQNVFTFSSEVGNLTYSDLF